MTRQGFIATLFAPLLAKLAPKKESRIVFKDRALVIGDWDMTQPPSKIIKHSDELTWPRLDKIEFSSGRIIVSDPYLAESLRNHPACKK